MSALHTEFVPELAVPVPAELSVRVCGSWKEFEQFRAPWNSLLERNQASSIFQTPEWLAAWWQAFGKGKQLFGLIFSDAKGDAVGIAPLYAERQPVLGLKITGFSITTLRMVGAGSGDSDALDFITAPGFEQHCAYAFCNWLAQNVKCDVCSLETLPENSLIAKHLLQHAKESGWRIDSTFTPNFVIDLPPSWPQYISTLESSFRPLLTRYPRRLQSRFTVGITRCERMEDLHEQLQVLFRLHQMRWTERGEPGAFASAERCEFYFQMSQAFLQRGWLEFWLLSLNGETVGAQFCFRYHNTVSLLQEGFDPKYTAEKIGYALRAHVLEKSIRAGSHRYDFLGGADAYKARFGARQANYLNLTFAGPSLRGRIYLALQMQKRQFKAWLKNKLPAGMLAVLRREAARETTSAVQ
ncbi:MAG TPA: GNAT family N-acetyltransferase [Candidatus Angelobacter sp.]|nr:GNAT family N-acetyltransferase [Candidatus Angelobacter sp.]